MSFSDPFVSPDRDRGRPAQGVSSSRPRRSSSADLIVVLVDHPEWPGELLRSGRCPAVRCRQRPGGARSPRARTALTSGQRHGVQLPPVRGVPAAGAPGVLAPGSAPAEPSCCWSASYLFYALWDWRFLPLMLLSTATDFVGRPVARAHRRRPPAQAHLPVSLAVNLGVLGVLQVLQLLHRLRRSGFLERHRHRRRRRRRWQILLPVGISFYTFHGISYTFDVYRREIRASHVAARLRRVRGVLPPAGRRPDRAGPAPAARSSSTTGGSPDVEQGPQRGVPDPAGAVQEGGDRRRPRARTSTSAFRRRQPGG